MRLAALLVFSLVIQSVSSVRLFGDVSDFNLVTLDADWSFSCASSDVRGRVASRGNTALINYNIACQANLVSNPSMNDQCPQFGSWTCGSQGFPQGDVRYWGLIAASFDHGAAFKFSQGQISGGVAWGSNKEVAATTIPNCNVNAYSLDEQPIRWGPVASNLLSLSNSIRSRATTGTTNYNSGNQIQLTGSGAPDIETFFIDGNMLSAATNLQAFTNVQAATIFINVNGTNVTFSGGSDSSIKALSSKIVWNFYEATTINNVNHAVYGSLLAPSANLINPTGVFWGQVFVNSFTSGAADFWNPNQCAQVNWIPFTGQAPTTTGRCGDGNVDQGESCDLGPNNGSPSSCCTTSCRFSPSNQTCRAAVGVCDSAEMCTGSSSSCPTDAFLPSTVPCSQPFGICDVQVTYRCPGDGPQCVETAPAPLWTWDAFNVISFDSYTCHGGDVEGALAVRNRADLSNYGIGLQLSNKDAYTLFSLVCAGNVTYTDGEVRPIAGSLWTSQDDQSRNFSHPWGYIGIGGNFNAPDYLQSSLLTGVYLTSQEFDTAYNYYSTIQTLLSQLPVTTSNKVIHGDGLEITCMGTSDLYHVKVDGDVLSGTNWYLLVGCTYDAAFIIDVTGVNDITIKGAPFPGIVEKVVYNVLGKNRAIYGTNGVQGNILAPNSAYHQTSGVTYGRVIVGDVLEARQNNKPNCTNFALITITNVVMKPVKAGDTEIYVYDIGNYKVGDVICIGGTCVPIASGIVVSNGVSGTNDNIVVVGSPFPIDVQAPTFIETPVVHDPTRKTKAPIPIVTRTPPTFADFGASSASLAAPFVFFACVAALFL